MMSFLFLGFLYMTGSLWMRVVVWGNGLFPGVLHGFFYSACLLPQAAPDDFYEFCVFFKFFRRWFVGFLFLAGKAGGSFQKGYPAGAFIALDGACYFFRGYFVFVRALRLPEEFFQLALSSCSKGKDEAERGVEGGDAAGGKDAHIFWEGFFVGALAED